MMKLKTDSEIEVGVDTGGTFTDIVCYRDGVPFSTSKLPSTPSDPSKAILKALEQLQSVSGITSGEISKFSHGTTVATNALIERTGGNLGILATNGFSDVLEIGRQMRRELYEASLKPQAPVFLAPGHRRKGVVERVASDGSILVPLDENSVIAAGQELIDDGVSTIAICFLFSFLNPVHELRARDILVSKFPDLKISISSEVDPTFREYERTVVTAFDAYVKPVVSDYLACLDEELKKAGLLTEPKIMQSRGSMSAISVAGRSPVRLFLSGPAAGVVGAARVGKSLDINNLISVDIGGTSCDIALIKNGRPNLRAEGEIQGFPVRVNMVDVNAIGAGGGSLVWLDTAGGLRVGPNSAGASPGPVCYGRGGKDVTVTDASLVLGFINPKYFAGGSIELRYELARRAIEENIAGPLDLSLEEAAKGIHQVVNAQMAEGIRLVSIQRGVDPRQFTLVALGGAGPIHAVALAGELGITKIIIPRNPGVLSASGLLAAPVEHEAVSSFQKNISDVALGDLFEVLHKLDRQCCGLMEAEGIEGSGVEVQHLADVCYVGQSYHLAIPFEKGDKKNLEKLVEEFHYTHDAIYGHSIDAPVRLINLRSIHRSIQKKEFSDEVPGDLSKTSSKGKRSVLFLKSNTPKMADIFERKHLPPGTRIVGPAIIEQLDSTSVIDEGWEGFVYPSSDIVIEQRLAK